MAITTLQENLDFLEVTAGYFVVNAVNNVMNFTSSEGGPVDIIMDDGSYDGAGLASELQTQMNASATLTGSATITFAVSYSSSTRKFTIDSTVGNTIAYDHSESDGGLTLGFNADATAAQTITSNLAAGDPTADVDLMREAAESWVQNIHCKRTFEDTAYTAERYSGKGYQFLHLNNYPITAIDRIAIGVLDVLRIKNTNTTTKASVSATTTGVRLVYNGTADTTVLFATYTTLSDVVSAVNSVGSGWTAEILSSTYNAWLSTDLVDMYAMSAIDSNWVSLQVPDDAESQSIKVYPEKGQVYLGFGFPKGYLNIFIDYSAGYSSANMPEDLKLAIKIIVKYIHQKREEESFGASNLWIDKIRILYEIGHFPKEALDILGGYRRYRI